MRACQQGFGVRFQAAASPQAAQGKVPNFSNWADYLPEGFLEEFEAKSGVKVRLRTYQCYEALQRRMEGNTDIDDLVVPSLSYAKEHLTKDLHQPLDKRLLPNFRNVDPDVLKVMARLDPGNRHFLLAIPAKARNTANAHAFINFYLEALQGAKMPSEMKYPAAIWRR